MENLHFSIFDCMKNKLNLLIVALFLLIQTTLAQTWTQIGSDIDGEAEFDHSGWSVSLSSDGKTVAIGAPWNIGNADDAGHVRVYQNVNGTWTQIGSDIDGEAEFDRSGESVSLSSDGKTVAIGAPENNVSDAGHVRVYQNINGSWTQIGSEIDGAKNDFSGYSVSLSSDGKTVAIGAPGNDAGHVRVYTLETGASTETIEAHKIHISPNPVADILTVNGISQPVEFQITDLIGKEILSGEMSNNSVDVSTLKVGIYFLKVEKQSIQFVKE